jgi:hypothetical protein
MERSIMHPSHSRRIPLVLVVLSLLLAPAGSGLGSFLPWAAAPSALSAQDVPHPTDVIGFELGTDYMLADLGQLYRYYEALAEASPRVELAEIGRSVRGEPL